MKLSYLQLSAHLKADLAPLYFIHGDEIFLNMDAATCITQAAETQGYKEKTLKTLDNGQELENTLRENTQHLSIFATKKILQINLQFIKFINTYGKLLENYAKNPCSDVVVIIRAAKLESKLEKSVWYKSLEKNGIVLPIWPISLEQLPQWIIDYAKKHALLIHKEAAYHLATLVEGNLLAAAQEVEKLALLGSHQIIDQALIEKVATDNAHYDIFNLVDSACRGLSKQCLHILETLKGNTEPTLILWAFTRELRMLIAIFLQLADGYTLTDLMDTHRIFGKRKQSVKMFITQHTLPQAKLLLLQAAYIDRIIKGIETANVWEELQKLSLAIAAGKDKLPTMSII